MKTNLPTLLLHSANLLNVLNSVFGDNLNKEIDNIFKHCLENGGLNEIDFTRPEGQSYNPRPARIALILINDSKCYDQEIIQSAMLAAIDDKKNHISIEANKICKHGIKENIYDEASKLIALALHLDRARHFHLNPNYIKEKKDFHILTKNILHIAGGTCNKVSELITYWLQRDERKN